VPWLTEFFGSATGFSAPVADRHPQSFAEDLEAFMARDLSATGYV
jgi:hypothetical protein